MDNEELVKEVQELKKIVNAQNRILTKIAKSMYLVPMSDKEAEKFELERRANVEQSIKVHHTVDDRMPTENNYASIFGDISSDMDVFADVIADDLR